MAHRRGPLTRWAAVAPLAVLLLAAPSPPAAAANLRAAAGATDPAAPLVAAVALAAWALATWLLLVAVATAGAQLPGLAGRSCAALARRVAPAAVRRAVQVALGLTVAAGTCAAVAAPAHASGSTGGRPPAVPALDWPTTARPAASTPADASPAGPSTAPSLDWPAPTVAHAAPTAARPAPTAVRPAPLPRPAAAAAVVVQPGDSLWAIAAGHLPSSATPAQVAQVWPAWWSANRAAIGADPDLIHPGTRLLPPAEHA